MRSEKTGFSGSQMGKMTPTMQSVFPPHLDLVTFEELLVTVALPAAESRGERKRRRSDKRRGAVEAILELPGTVRWQL